MSANSSSDTPVAERLSAIESRLEQLERHLGIASEVRNPPSEPPAAAMPEALVETADAEERADEELEWVVGQSWFALVGILVLTLGAAFALSLPFGNLPAALPSLVGYASVAALWFLAHLARSSSFGLASMYLRGAGMALLYFATLRLYSFGNVPVLTTGSIVGKCVLLLVIGANLLIAYRLSSAVLFSVGLTTGLVTAMAVGTPLFEFSLLSALALLAVGLRWRRGWTGVLLYTTAAVYITHLLWALNNPLLGRPIRFATEPVASTAWLLLNVIILASGLLLRRERSPEPPSSITAAVLNCTLGYGVFLIHTLAAFTKQFATCHLAASAVFLGLAVAFWVREQSRASTFFYAMTGYTALSLALLRMMGPPEVFVWLSLQSVIVVATALWFRSRFIVVSNFFIFLAMVLGYAITRKEESGISLGFGLVALVTARVLNWQQQRLELKTEMMRNAYLGSAFFVFPYSLYYLVPRTFVSVAWVCLAVSYYVLNLIVRSPKYRWMGHFTLLLTVLYLLVIGIIQLEPTQRILSFVVLGTALVFVSLVFTRLRMRRDASAKPRPPTQP